MNRSAFRFNLKFVLAFAALLTAASGSQAQTTKADPPAAPASPAAAAPVAAAAPASAEGDAPQFKQEELDQMLAPLALYPDALLSQVLMASTYPLEIVEAERWLKANASLKGDAQAKALEEQTWDPSVKSLIAFPDVLTMLSDKLDWTQKLGDAFIGQQKQVLDTIQSLRAKANEQGKLQSNQQQTVNVEQQGSSQVIVIESTDPDVIYVPSYDPVVVYGSWPYPSYPPYPYYPPGYVASGVVAFGAGVALGAAWGYAWGNCDWGHGDVDIDINQNFNRNTNINRNDIRTGNGKWQHNPAHRGGVPYRDRASAQRFGGTSANQAARARDSYRGRAEAGRGEISRGGAENFRPGSGGAGERRDASRPGAGGSGERRSTGGSRDGAFRDSNQGGSTARQNSDRGHQSRNSGARSGSGGGRSSAGGSRGGGGRSSGGGGGRRGGGGGGRGGGRRG